MGALQRAIAGLLIPLVLLAGCQSADRLKEEADGPGKGREAKVIRVIDGDTLSVRMEGRIEKVRLIGVNTPETNHPKIGAEVYGKEASRFTTKHLAGKDVRLETDVEERDQYGRLLAYVWLGDELFNAMLLEEGMAQVMTVPPNVRYQEKFLRLQREAREKEKGLWGKDVSARNRAETSREGDCTGKIKGNINRDGEKIFHTRESPQYESTKPERWFCTEEEAKKAGFRPPKGPR
ncbi:micrococcal nuclease [Melghirimyces profundicolus]|uniref:Micrococcal nuclease n=1 Tax=Melghirimyces profundicolus TaxID=1242148 RepID=A0A2T6C4I1_9BACL|nr:thermonuclease family protein [Melghirimyces profundicolus]PTX63187.1 micrococcal nuclease [Melghirimyces profundicolus]